MSDAEELHGLYEPANEDNDAVITVWMRTARRNQVVASSLELRIDYIFIGRHRPNGAGRVEECRIVANESVDGVYPSDHYGVFAVLSGSTSGRIHSGIESSIAS